MDTVLQLFASHAQARALAPALLASPSPALMYRSLHDQLGPTRLRCQVRRMRGGKAQ
ncbi:MAG: hypothetical protein ACREX7_06615 [Casimicrobiaceae bacterium]